MIIRGKARGNASQLAEYIADYLLNNPKNDRVELLELSGTPYRDLHRAFRGWEAEAIGTRCEKPFWFAAIRSAPDEHLTREQHIEAANILERHLGLEGQPRALVIHEQNGHQHLHVVWSRIDRETGKAISDSFSHHKNVAASHEIVERFGLKRVEGPDFADKTLDRRTRRALSKEKTDAAKQERLRKHAAETEPIPGQAATQDFAYTDKPVVSPPTEPPQPSKPFSATDALAELTRQHSTFSDRDLYRLADKVSETGSQAAALISQVLTSPELVPLEKTDSSARYTSREVLEIELRMQSAGDALAMRTNHRVDPKLVARSPKKWLLNDGQRNAFAHIVNGADLAVVSGYAGTGKSTMLGAAREVFEAAGYRVRGAALSGIAADSLEKGSGIRSTTIHSLFYRLEHLDRQQERVTGLEQRMASMSNLRTRAEMGFERDRLKQEINRSRLTPRDILVIDEAGMVGSRMMSRVLQTCEQAGAKVVLVGDAEQLQAIDAGAPFRTFSNRYGHAGTPEVLRQNEEWQQAATVGFATEKTAEALHAYKNAGRIHQFDTSADAKAGLVGKWSIDSDQAPEKSRIILAYTRDDVSDLNKMARGVYREKNKLGTDVEIETAAGTKPFATGDRIYFTKNDSLMGVRNGTLGTISEMSSRAINNGERSTVTREEPGRSIALTITLDDGRNITLDTGDYNSFSHGYASTVHKSQGVTVDQSYVMASKYMDRHAAYVGMTRHRENADLYYSSDEMTGYRKMTWLLSRNRRKDTTLDYIYKAQKGAPVPEGFNDTVRDIWDKINGNGHNEPPARGSDQPPGRATTPMPPKPATERPKTGFFAAAEKLRSRIARPTQRNGPEMEM